MSFSGRDCVSPALIVGVVPMDGMPAMMAVKGCAAGITPIVAVVLVEVKVGRVSSTDDGGSIPIPVSSITMRS